MKIVYVEPGKPAVAMGIDKSLSTYQGLVDGYIEVVYPFDDNAILVCNDEGKLNGSPFNRYLYHNGEPYDAVMGSFFIVGDDGEGDFMSLTDEQLTKYTEMYKDVPQFNYPHLAEPRAEMVSFDTMDDLIRQLWGDDET